MEQPNDESSFYKFGLFYCNPADKRIFVPMRYGFGWTFNFANLWSYAIILIFIGVCVKQFYSHQ
jgi:uncharacterized membrane protein